MDTGIIFSAEQLLRTNTVESERLELKASWDAEYTGPQIIKTISAFANDFQNQNGGYVILGVAEENGRAVLPPKGISESDIDMAQRWIRGQCHRLEPQYSPHFEVGVIDGAKVLVVWAPASDMRPHLAPSGRSADRKYFVRVGSETVEAKGTILTELIQLTARTPFDNRRNANARVEDIKESKVREFLNDIGSSLINERDTRSLYRKLNIAVPVNHHDDPRNVGLLFFSDNPERWFPGARIEVVQFANGAGGNVIEEKVFRGGIHEQLRGALQYLETISQTLLEKNSKSVRVRSVVNYPILALREALVNAVYHRSYENSLEPVKVYLYPDKIKIISYPGPVHGIELSSLVPPYNIPPVPARNGRIGEFLKDLHLAESRNTGLNKIAVEMQNNGSAAPAYQFDEARSYFQVTLPAHPEYVAVSTIRDVAHLKAIGHEEEALQRLRESWEGHQNSPTLVGELLKTLVAVGDVSGADEVLARFRTRSDGTWDVHVLSVYADALLNAGLEDKAGQLLKQCTAPTDSQAIDMAILARRMRKNKEAHRYFDLAGTAIALDARALHEFAQTKIALAGEAFGLKRLQENRRLLGDALRLLERVIQMNGDKVRVAWAWRDKARVQKWLGYPKSDVLVSIERACELLPDEASRFQSVLRC